MRLIDEKALKEYQMQIRPEWIKYHLDIVKGMVEIFARAIDNQPTIDAEPVRHGHWIEKNEGAALQLVCEKCGYDYIEADPDCIERHNFCPNCGVKMDEEAKK